MVTFPTKKIILAAACGLTLSACQKSAGSVVVAPVTKTISGDTVALLYDSATQTYAVTVNGVLQADYVAEPGADHGAMGGLKNAASTKFGAVGQTADSLVVVGGTESDGVNPYGFVTYRRLATTSMPTSGSATFTGDYSGLLRRDASPTDDVIRRARGDVSMTANFGASTVSGGITNRALYTINTNTLDGASPVSDLVLTSATIDATGAFSGTTSGGGVTTAGWDPASGGSYSGLISGSSGGEMVGGLSLTHNVSGSATTYTEIGGFLATK